VKRESINAIVDNLQIPAWIYNVPESRITWANRLGLKHWKSDSLEELRSRRFANDMSMAVRMETVNRFV